MSFSLENRYASLHCSLRRLLQGIVYNLKSNYIAELHGSVPLLLVMNYEKSQK